MAINYLDESLCTQCAACCYNPETGEKCKYLMKNNKCFIYKTRDKLRPWYCCYAYEIPLGYVNVPKQCGYREENIKKIAT
jgi:hypothetical protein